MNVLLILRKNEYWADCTIVATGKMGSRLPEHATWRRRMVFDYTVSYCDQNRRHKHLGGVSPELFGLTSA